MDLFYDNRRGAVRGPAAPQIFLSPDEEAVLFWLTSGARLERLAVLTGRQHDALEETAATLATQLGLKPEALSRCNLTFKHGHAPRPTKPWAERTMAHLVHESLASRGPEDVFIYDASGGALTARETRMVLARIRAGLRRSGVQHGDTIAADSALRLETYLISLAAWLHGAAVLRLNSNAAAEVAQSQLRRTPAKIVFTKRLEDLGDALADARCVSLDDGTSPDNESGFERWLSDAPDPGAEDFDPAAVAPDDICTISTTSGTTGVPKAVLLSHHSIWWGCDRACRMGAFTSEDIFSSATDLVGDMSCNTLFALPLRAQGKVVIPRPAARGSPLDFVQDCIDFNVTTALVVPASLRAILAAGDRITQPFFATIRNFISATAPFGTPLAEAFRQHSQAQIIEYLGSREYGGSLTARTMDADVISAGGGSENEALVRIVNDAGAICEPGEIGHMLVVSLGLMEGYVLPEGRAPNAFSDIPQRPPGFDLWYNTSDLASYSPTGGIQIQGRSSDLMKSPDGQIVMPIEIENVLHRDPRVKEACVFSVLDAEGCERIGGAVIPKGTADANGLGPELRQVVQDALGHLKTPFALWITGSFPRAAQSKPDKPALKSRFAEQFAESGAIRVPAAQ